MTLKKDAYKESLIKTRQEYIDKQIVAQEREDWERCGELQQLIDELDSLI